MLAYFASLSDQTKVFIVGIPIGLTLLAFILINAKITD
jgi:hypothetical protein